MNLYWCAFYAVVMIAFSVHQFRYARSDVRWASGFVVAGYLLSVVVAVLNWQNHWAFDTTYDVISIAAFLRHANRVMVGVAILSAGMIVAHLWLDGQSEKDAIAVRLHDEIVNVLLLAQVATLTLFGRKYAS